MASKKVMFKPTVSEHAITLDRNERRNPEYKEDRTKALGEVAKVGTGRKLAERSLERVDNGSSCETCKMCDCSRHKHEETIKNFYTIIDCTQSKISKCKFCDKNICEACFVKHAEVHILELETEALRKEVELRKKHACKGCKLCQCTRHDHDETIKHHGLTITCENTSYRNCPHCPKIICQKCYIKHINAHTKPPEQKDNTSGWDGLFNTIGSTIVKRINAHEGIKPVNH